MGGAQQQDAGWVDPQLGEAGGRNLAMFEGGKILADPQQLFLSPHALGKAQGKACGAGIAGEDLVQRAARDAAAQRRIGTGMAKGACAQALARPQDGVEKLAGAGQFLRKIAHMFPICSSMLTDQGRVNTRNKPLF